jgi:hypothetical protein
VKCWPKIASLLLSVAALIVSAQSAPDGKGDTQETQMRGYWIDPSTGLMWAGKDNGKDVSWKNAGKYCRDLRVAGYSDWRLATLAELGMIYDRNANAPGRDGLGASTWHVKADVFLTGYQWSSSQRNDDRGRPSGYAWYFDFNQGRTNNQPTGFPYSYSFMRALCVRGTHQ